MEKRSSECGKRVSLSRNALTPIQEEPKSTSTTISSERVSSLAKLKEKPPTKLICKSTCPNLFANREPKKVPPKSSKSSLLRKPFAFRNVDSLQHAIDSDEKRLLELYLASTRERDEYEDDFLRHAYSQGSLSTSSSETRFTDFKSQTDIKSGASDTSMEKKKLEYLMGLPPQDEEEQAPEPDLEEIIIDDSMEAALAGQSEAMKQAQRYLRVHKIFEFFQFLISQLLSVVPDNPIIFLLELLDRCVIYRAGMGQPPVLYQKKHIEALFNLMDRMRTGYITKEQYVIGMKTLGICSYNTDPVTDKDGTIHKDVFIEEAYETLISMLNDLIRRRWIHVANPPIPMRTPPPTPQFSIRSAKTIPESNK